MRMITTTLLLFLMTTLTMGQVAPFDWKNATVYFMLTDRFNNGDTTNDIRFNRTEPTKPLRRFMGGDLKGITQKINDGYFTDLGVDVLWFSPVMEQIHGAVNEGQGNTYAYHGYWIKDWTATEPGFGSKDDLRELVQTAHAHGIRVMLDVVINHTGPVTADDPVWPSDWVRTTPPCTYQDYNSTVFCTLVRNLPDIRTERTEETDLPPALVQQWKEQGRYEEEMASLDAFFARTGYPRTPRYYIIKWLTDYIRAYGIDGFRVDTVKHTEPEVWADLAKEAQIAFNDWKSANHEAIQEDQDFFMLAETYNYAMLHGQWFDFGDRQVNYFDNGFDSQINFGFKSDAQQDYETLFSAYAAQLHSGDLRGLTTMNYISSHDDGWPYDPQRDKPLESANKLLLSPGQVQIYYGDETARPLHIEGAEGDVNLRGMMNWGENPKVLQHWQKLGQFRQRHPAIGNGSHQMLSYTPYVFARTTDDGSDRVVVGLDMPEGPLTLEVGSVFQDGTLLHESYCNLTAVVNDGKVQLDRHGSVVLLEEAE